jgi:hypothetical protein
MGNWIFVAIAVIFLVIPVIMAIYRLIKISTSDTITFIKGNKRLTVSSGHLSAEDKKELVNF